MSELNELLKDIEKLRKTLYELIEKKEANLQDPEIITASKTLNIAITKYNEMIRKKL